MAEQEYFKSALSDFTYEAASGGAIRHLTDLGYTVKQICEQLSFPTPYTRVQKTVWQHLLTTGVILTQEPGSGKGGQQGKAEYAVERDQYGRTSFRRVSAAQEKEETICWKERTFDADGTVSGRKLAVYLSEKCKENEGEAYISCRFGKLIREDTVEWERTMSRLNERQQEYLAGLPWEERICYHRLDGRMQEIAVKLYAAGSLREQCYFKKTEERVLLL